MSFFNRDKDKKPADFSNVQGGHSSTARTIEPRVAPPPVAPQSTVAPTPPPPSSPTQTARTYTVAVGDSLSKIAKRLYGDMNRWTDIFAANKGVIGNDPDKIEPGQVLVVPA